MAFQKHLSRLSIKRKPLQTRSKNVIMISKEQRESSLTKTPEYNLTITSSSSSPTNLFTLPYHLRKNEQKPTLPKKEKQKEINFTDYEWSKFSKYLKPRSSKYLEDDITFSSTRELSLICPLTLKRLVSPVNFEACKHLECCEFDAVKDHFLKSRTLLGYGNYYKCPICGIRLGKITDGMTYWPLVLCHLRPILNKVDTSCTKIVIDVDRKVYYPKEDGQNNRASCSKVINLINSELIETDSGSFKSPASLNQRARFGRRRSISFSN